jgi:long-subunit fatty acid transport protein
MAQNNSINYGSFSGSIGSSQGSIYADYFHVWKLGKSKKMEVGLGGRFTSYFGSKQYYTSAPASLADDDTKIDSLYVENAQMNALNLAIHLGYRFSPKFGAGFNIDAIGFSFGGKQSTTYLTEGESQSASAKPTTWNTLLVGNNDHGTLNSEFFVRYFFKGDLAIKVAYQYLFTEYTTDTEVQQLPEVNDRFRNKSGMFSVGITKQF